MGSGSTMVGKEVPVISNDAVKWIHLSLPSSPNNTEPPTPNDASSYDYASSSHIANPSTYLIWRIHKSQPHVLELLEIPASQPFPKTGLRFTFPYTLCPFAFISKNNHTASSSRFPYLLYVLTVSGVAYLLKIRNFSTYVSCSVVPADELSELNVYSYSNNVPVTAVTATSGCLVVGRNDGSVSCFQLGVLDPTTAGFVVELRDEVGIGRLWGLMSRGKTVSLVQNMVIHEIHGKRFLFVLHLDGSLRVWDLACNYKVFSHMMSTTTTTGASFMKLWLGQPCLDSSTIPVAILCRLDERLELISTHTIQYNFSDRIIFSMKSSSQNISLEEGGCIDVKLTSDRIWILKGDEVVSLMFSANNDEEEEFSYALQEEFVAEQLFQRSDHLADEILQIAHSLFSSSKGFEDIQLHLLEAWGETRWLSTALF